MHKQMDTEKFEETRTDSRLSSVENRVLSLEQELAAVRGHLETLNTFLSKTKYWAVWLVIVIPVLLVAFSIEDHFGFFWALLFVGGLNLIVFIYDRFFRQRDAVQKNEKV